MKAISDATPAQLTGVLNSLSSYISGESVTATDTDHPRIVNAFITQLRSSIEEPIRLTGTVCNKAIVATIDSLIEEVAYHAEDYPEDDAEDYDGFPFSLYWDDLDNVVDNNIDTSHSRLLAWLQEDPSHLTYVDDAIKEHCINHSMPPTLYTLIQSGQHAFIYSIVAITTSLLYTFLDTLDYDDTFNLVSENCGCPKCKERDADFLLINTTDDTVTCLSCGTLYILP